MRGGGSRADVKRHGSGLARRRRERYAHERQRYNPVRKWSAVDESWEDDGDEETADGRG